MSRTKGRLVAASPELIAELCAVVGPQHAVRDPGQQEPYLREWRDRYRGRTPVVLRPASTEEVSRIVKVCYDANVGLVPQGGNTGLVGGQIPAMSGNEIVVSLTRLSHIRSIDPADTSLVAEAGVTLSAVHEAAEAAGRLFPLSMASQGSCTIGGNLATNAGGVAVLAYGTARSMVLGIEAVLANGEIFDALSALKKDNTGYDLKDLLIGSEGTLGIITAATLKLWPRPADVATAFVATSSLSDLAQLFSIVETQLGPTLTAFEFMSERAMQFAIRHTPNVRSPFSASHAWYALIEVSASRANAAADLLQNVLEKVLHSGSAADTAFAVTPDRQRELWRLRDIMSEAQKFEGGSIKHDISVPVAALPAFLIEADALVERLCPGARPVPFGHFGDGNVHYNVSQPTAWTRLPSSVMESDLGGGA